MKFEKSFIIEKFVKDTRSILGNKLIEKYLFGSYALNTQTALSDIDILFIVDTLNFNTQSQLSDLASDYSLNHDVCISPILTDKNIWEKNKKFNTLFYQEIHQSGIRL